MVSRLALLPSLCLALCGVGCRTPWSSSAPDGPPESLLAEADRAHEVGEVERGLEILIALRGQAELGPDLREEVERRVVERASQRIQELRGDPEGLERLWRMELPRDLRARSGLRIAEALYDAGHPIDALDWLDRVDAALPHHGERGLAGRILARVGLDLIHRKGRYSLFFRYRPKGIKALEKLVVRYPADPRCPEAYFVLSEAYEEDGEIDYALERIEDLLVYHAGSPLAVAARARLPYLRLKRLERDDYDRSQLVIAQHEIADWLASYPGHELEGWVRELRATCAERLAESDLILARYYRRIGVEEGRELHAQRALATARDASLEGPLREALALLGETDSQPPTSGTVPASSPAPAAGGR